MFDNVPLSSLERFHLRVVNDTIDVLYRPVHAYIEFVSNDETGKNRIKELASMNRDEFRQYLKAVKTLPIITNSKIRNVLNGSHDEEWFRGAWKRDTDRIFEEIQVSNPVEIPIITSELIS